MPLPRALSRALKLGLAALAIGLTGGPTVEAQNDALQFVLEQARQRRLQQQRPQRRVVSSRPRSERRASTVIVGDTPEKPKVDPSAFVLVLGDSFGDLLGGGLDEAYADHPETAIVRRARPESGLVRADFYDWPKAVRDLLAGEQKITVAVIQMGANDRQPIRDEANLVHEPGGDRWKEIYVQRVDSVVRSFVEKRIPVLWVGLPPMQAPKFSADMLALNDLVREQVGKSGGQFIDIWEAFVDSENRFAAYGPDLTGQNARLRTQDGVHFTRAGARKAAHFVELELKRLIESRPASTVIAVPSDPTRIESLPLELQPGGVERAIDRMVSALPEPSGLPTLAAPSTRPLAGPIVALTSPVLSPGGILASAREPRAMNEAQALIDRVFGEGRPVEAKPGRADDFRWPR